VNSSLAGISNLFLKYYLNTNTLCIYFGDILSIITIRIPRELKEKMKKYREINWSEVVRRALEERIRIQERIEAMRRMDEIRRKVKPVKRGELDKWIREDRIR